MQIDKEQIIELLKSRGDQGKAEQAQNDLPEKVDTDQHGGLLDKLGIDPADLMGNIPGLGGLGG